MIIDDDIRVDGRVHLVEDVTQEGAPRSCHLLRMLPRHPGITQLQQRRRLCSESHEERDKKEIGGDRSRSIPRVALNANGSKINIES